MGPGQDLADCFKTRLPPVGRGSRPPQASSPSLCTTQACSAQGCPEETPAPLTVLRKCCAPALHVSGRSGTEGCALGVAARARPPEGQKTLSLQFGQQALEGSCPPPLVGEIRLFVQMGLVLRVETRLFLSVERFVLKLTFVSGRGGGWAGPRRGAEMGCALLPQD